MDGGCRCESSPIVDSGAGPSLLQVVVIVGH